MSSRTLPLPPSFFFFNDTATTEIYTLSLHDALPISLWILHRRVRILPLPENITSRRRIQLAESSLRSEEHTSELQSHLNLVCRLLLEKKKKRTKCDRIACRVPMSWAVSSRII